MIAGKRIILVAAVIICLLFCGCGGQGESETAESAGTQTQTEAVSAEPEALPSEEVNTASSEEEKAASSETSAETGVSAEVSDEAEEAIRKQAETLLKDGQRITSVCTADFDRNGDCEGFVFIGNNDTDEMGGETGDIWFVRDGSAELFETDEYSGTQKIMMISKTPFYVYDRVFATGVLNYVCTVEHGKPVSTPVSGLGYVGEPDGNGNFTIVPGGDYDASYDAEMDLTLGHTWKPYWFYFRDGDFHEYGGLKITEEELSSLRGGTEALAGITGYRINDIFYRGNGLITVNYDDSPQSLDGSYNNSYLLLEYRNGVVSEVEDEFGDGRDGIYLDSISNIAVYPSGV